MPGRTLASWYGRSKLDFISEDAGSEVEGSSSEAQDNRFPAADTSFYDRQTPQYEQQQYDANYGYFPVNQSNSGNTGYTEQQRTYSSNTSYQQYPLSASPGGYQYTNHGNQSQHGMNYSNNQSVYCTSGLGHYASPNPAHSGQHTYQNNQQQWTNYGRSPPQVIGSQTPSPAHTPSPVSNVALHSSQAPAPNTTTTMSGQYPSHHGHHMGGSGQSHGMAWNHSNVSQTQGMGIHQGNLNSTMPGGVNPQAHSYYSPLSLAVHNKHQQPAHQQTLADRRSGSGTPSSVEMQSQSPSQAWGGASGGTASLGSAQKSLGDRPHNPLASLQMLVNQDMNRSVPAYRSAAMGQEMLDLSTSVQGRETPDAASQSRLNQDGNCSSAPICLAPTTQSSEKAALVGQTTVRNGTITTVASPPLLNGELSSSADSGISSPMGSGIAGATPTSTPLSDATNVVPVLPEIPKDKTENVGSNPGAKNCEKDSVVMKGDQSYPFEERKDSEKKSIGEMLYSSFKSEHAAAKRNAPENKTLSAKSQDSPADVQLPGASQEAGKVNKENSLAEVAVPGFPPRGPFSPTNIQSEDIKKCDLTDGSLPNVTSPTSNRTKASVKRFKKVDAIVENLVESGSTKLVSTSITEQPAGVIPSVVMITSEDSNADSSSNVGSPQSSPQKLCKQKSPDPMREDAVSPTFDDSSLDKPRRKRKSDNPTRLKTPESEVANSPIKDTKLLSEEEPVKLPVQAEQDRKEESKKEDPKETMKACPAINVQAQQETKTESPTDKTVVKEKADVIQETKSETIPDVEAELAKILEAEPAPEKKAEPKEEMDMEPDPLEATLAALMSDKPEEVEASSKVIPALTPQVADVTEKPFQSEQDLASSNPGSIEAVENINIKKEVADTITIKTEPGNPQQKNENGDTFKEVENELAKMFAGIVETDEVKEENMLGTPGTPENGHSDSALYKDTSLNSTMLGSSTGETSIDAKPISRRGRPKGSRNKLSRRSADSIFGTSSAESTPKKKKQKKSDGESPRKLKKAKLFLEERDGETSVPKKKRKSDGKGVMVKMESDIKRKLNQETMFEKLKVPYVHIEGPKDNPFSVTVVNLPSREDEESEKVTKKKKLSYHNELDYRGKVSKVGFSSTLSARYDAYTADRTWICVFCKHGSHSEGLGDLFGPYYIGREKMDEEFSADEKEITAEQKKGGRNKRSIRRADMADQFSQKMSKKAKKARHHLENTPVLGMSPIVPGLPDAPHGPGKVENGWEVWVHEPCAVWAVGVYQVGSRVVGLQEAVWDAVHTVCVKCNQGGANVGCVKRGCEERLHYGCARDYGWELDEEGYIGRCHHHKQQQPTSSASILPT